MEFVIDSDSVVDNIKFLKFIHKRINDKNIKKKLFANGFADMINFAMKTHNTTYIQDYRDIESFMSDVEKFTQVMFDDIMLFFLAEGYATNYPPLDFNFDSTDSTELYFNITPDIKISNNGDVNSNITLYFDIDGKSINKKIYKL